MRHRLTVWVLMARFFLRLCGGDRWSFHSQAGMWPRSQQDCLRDRVIHEALPDPNPTPTIGPNWVGFAVWTNQNDHVCYVDGWKHRNFEQTQSWKNDWITQLHSICRTFREIVRYHLVNMEKNLEDFVRNRKVTHNWCVCHMWQWAHMVPC